MDFSAIGEKIKELRKGIGLSQTELAKGICTQAQISKIEKGDVLPLASTLYLISERLGVDVNYFFDIGTTRRLDYVQEVSRQLKLARRRLDYKWVQDIVQTEEKNPLFKSNNKNMQLLVWHKAIYEYHVNNNFQEAWSLIDRAIDLTHDKVWTEREIEISISKGNFFKDEGMSAKALDIYKSSMNHLKHIIHLHDETIISRLMYSMAQTLTGIGDFDESISVCNDAIQKCIDRDNIYLFGELHYQIGYNYELQQQLSLAKDYMEKALFIFKLQKSNRYISFIQEKIDAWTNGRIPKQVIYKE